jgi:hypothetical protein
MYLSPAHRLGRTPERSLAPLLVQAGTARPLGSIMAFLSIALLILGAYVLVEVPKHPPTGRPYGNHWRGRHDHARSHYSL